MEPVTWEAYTNDLDAGRVGDEELKRGRRTKLFDNPFGMEDLRVFDDHAMQRLLEGGCFGFGIEDVARALQGASMGLISRVRRNVAPALLAIFESGLEQAVSREEVEEARCRVLDGLFWELTYWKTPELYEELTAGEALHPGIFQELEADVRGKVVVDVGAGCGRASFECMYHGASLVYAVEPSPALLRVLGRKLREQEQLLAGRIVPRVGCFSSIPLATGSVDMALACSAFTAESARGGEPGLAEMQRVTRQGGKIVIIWPRVEDREWLVARGFQYVLLPVEGEMCVHFRSLESALRSAQRFYAANSAVVRSILERGSVDIPYGVLGFNAPCDYCWQAAPKE